MCASYRAGGRPRCHGQRTGMRGGVKRRRGEQTKRSGRCGKLWLRENAERWDLPGPAGERAAGKEKGIGSTGARSRTHGGIGI